MRLRGNGPKVTEIQHRWRQLPLDPDLADLMNKHSNAVRANKSAVGNISRLSFAFTKSETSDEILCSVENDRKRIIGAAEVPREIDRTECRSRAS